jgi:hypothetical protein
MLMFTQKEVEIAFDDILKHADRAAISRITGIYNGVVDSMFNPNDERKSALFIALQILCAEDEIDETRGEALFQKIIEFRELSKKRKPSNAHSLAAATSLLNGEFKEFICARLEDLPLEKQFTELVDIEAQLAVTKQALIDEYNKQKETPRETSLKVAGRGNN